ncbi:MAG: glycosyltransferase [Saprospiraceae bacterium]|nr:glycosyltransferase [Saprospiraceae bacterium]
MSFFLIFLFVGSFAALAHTYIIYPWLMGVWTKGKSNNQEWFSDTEEWPTVSIICSLYNEEAVIADKLETIRLAAYPAAKKYAYIGSDHSVDQTNTIVKKQADQLDWLHFYPFAERRGKPPVINELIEQAMADHGTGPNHILLITDANVMLTEHTLTHLIRHFKNPNIAVVDAHMQHIGMKQQGISRAENTYISGEVMLKHREGILWQKMIGPFGGCYAIRSDYFEAVPPNFLVDDFYIAMKAFEKGGTAISDLEAVVYESISHDIKEEYRRKRRSSAGNFKNMHTFRTLWWPPFTILGFALFSHKILRWLGPFFLLLIWLCPLLLGVAGNLFFVWVFVSITCIMAGIPLLDTILKRSNLNALPLRGIRYFLTMNLALFEGFMNYLKGIKTNVWQPPKRND